MAPRTGDEVVIPGLSKGRYLYEIFVELGYFTQTAIGSQPLNLSDLLNWSQFTGYSLETWEAEALRRMSRVYLSELSIGEDPLAIPPHERQGD